MRCGEMWQYISILYDSDVCTVTSIFHSARSCRARSMYDQCLLHANLKESTRIPGLAKDSVSPKALVARMRSTVQGWPLKSHLS
jgi:hypothetical protein